MAADIVMAHHGELLRSAGAWTPPATMLGWWYGDSLTDGKWTDRSGNGCHAALTGSPTPGATGLTLNGSSQYATVPGACHSAATALTICAWAYPLRASGNGMGIVSGGFAGAKVRAWLGLGGNGMEATKVSGWSYPGTSFDTYAETGTRTAGQWVHCACVYANGDYRLYVNGAAAASQFTTQNLPSDSDVLYLGGGWTATNKLWYGTITDIQIYGLALTAEQIADVYANSSGAPV